MSTGGPPDPPEDLPPQKPDLHSLPIPDQLRAMLGRAEFSVQHQVTRQIPDPVEMAQYEKLVPGSAAMFLAQWKENQEHERKIATIQAEAIRDEIKAAATDRRSGLWMGWALAVGGLTGLIYMGLHGASWIGMGAVVLALGSLVWSVRRSTTAPDEQPPPEADDSDES